MNDQWIFLFFLILIYGAAYTKESSSHTSSGGEDSDKELRRTKRNIYQALLKRIGKRDQYVDLDHVTRTTSPSLKRRRKTNVARQSQEIRVEIRIIHNWRDEMSNRTTPEYQLLAGNIEDAIRNELNADLNFITSAVLKLNKTKDPHKMLADLSLRFFKTEVNPARHIQGIINRGWISGQQVDPTYFKNLAPKPRKPVPTPEWASKPHDDLHVVPAMKTPTANDDTINNKQSDAQTTVSEDEGEFGPRNKTNVQFKQITVTIKLKQRYLIYLADHSSPEYKELSGNVEQAVMKVFAHDVFFLEGHVIAFSESEEGRVLCIMAIQFRKEEKFSIEKCQAVISTGDLAGIPVDDQFFRVNSLSETDAQGQNMHPILSPPIGKIPKPVPNPHKIKMLPLHYIEMRFSVKINKTWSNTLCDNTTKEYADFSGQVEQAMDRGLFLDLDYIDSNVLEFIESDDHMIITSIATRFQLNETDPESTVRNVIINGTLSGIPLDPSFFFVFSISYRIKPPPPTANGVPQSDQGRTPNQQPAVTQTNGQKQQAENLEKSPSSFHQQQQQQQWSQQNHQWQQQQQQYPETYHPQQAANNNPYHPDNAVGNIQMTSQPPVRNSNPQDTFPTSYPAPQTSQQNWYPTPSPNPYLPTETKSPEVTRTDSTIAPYTLPAQHVNVPLNTIEGTVTLQQNWDSSLSDPRSQEYRILEYALVNAIKGLYGQTNEDVTPEIVGFSETAVPSTSETKVSARFKIVSLRLIESQPLEDAGRTNNIGGILIYENSLVIAGTINPITGRPSTTPSVTLCQQQQKSAEESSNGGQIGTFVPQCTPDGQYKPVQCHALTGFCWCVNNAGVRLQGTEQRYKQPDCEGIRILGNVYLPLNTTSDLPAGSCLTVSVQEMILCGKDVNCHIPVIVNETFRNISLIKNGIPYELMAPKMKPGRYVVSAVVNVGWCRVNSVKTKMLIHTGDYHSTDLYDIDVDADTKTIGQDIYVEPVLEKETGIRLYGLINLPKGTNAAELSEDSCMSIETKELKPCVGARCGALPTSSNATQKVELVNNAIPYDVQLPTLNPGTYVISVVIHTTKCVEDGQDIQDGDYFNEDMQEFTVEPVTNDIEKDIDVVQMKDPSAGTSVSGRVKFPEGVTNVDSGSCMTVSSRKLIKCKNNNCKIPPVSSKTFENITFDGTDGVPYSLSLPISSPGSYLISAVINNGWCKLHADGVWIKSGDFYNDKIHDFEIKNASEPIGKNIQTAIYNPSNALDKELTISGRIYLPKEGQQNVPLISPLSCLVIKVQEFTLCDGEINCIIPLATKEVLRGIHVEGDSIPYAVAMRNVTKKHYIISAVLNVDWCQEDNPYSPSYIRDGDLHNSDQEDFIVPDKGKEIIKDFQLSRFTEEITSNINEPPVQIPIIYNSTQESRVQEPSATKQETDVGNLEPDNKKNIDQSPKSFPETIAWNNEANSTATKTELPETSIPKTNEELTSTNTSTTFPASQGTGNLKNQPEKLTSQIHLSNVEPQYSSSSKNSLPEPSSLLFAEETNPTPVKKLSPLRQWNNIVINKTKDALFKEPSPSSKETNLPFIANLQEPQMKTSSMYKNTSSIIPDNSNTDNAINIPQQNNISTSTLTGMNSTNDNNIPSSKTELPEVSSLQNHTAFTQPTNASMVSPEPVATPDVLSGFPSQLASQPQQPPTEMNKTNSPLVTLPKGLPKSCDEIRNAGIGKMDGQYIVEARDGCHLSIICQDMEGPAPKEFLGGPSEDEWKYWHFAVLIKISDEDKRNIPQGACLENSEKGKDLLQRILIAGAKQGNPIDEWKTNIAKLLRSKRNINPAGSSVITKAKTIYKDQIDNSEWGVL